jgi:hypothetical protein
MTSLTNGNMYSRDICTHKNISSQVLSVINCCFDKETDGKKVIIVIVKVIIGLKSSTIINVFTYKSCDSSVGIALGYGLDDRGSRVRFPARAGNFSLHHCVQNDSGSHPASYPMGNRGFFPGVKRPGRKADHSPPSSAEVKECMELYLHSPIRLHGMMPS